MSKNTTHTTGKHDKTTRFIATIILAVLLVLAVLVIALSCTGCSFQSETSTKLQQDIASATEAGANIVQNQPAPTDLNYSLERYNLIKRAYWVNGQREKANTLVCAVERPLGYAVLISDNGAVVGSFVVDGKVSSLNSYLFPAYQDTVDRSAHSNTTISTELPGIDGAYGSNDTGIFFFTTDGKYIEWTGTYLYSDIPFEVDNPVVRYETDTNN